MRKATLHLLALFCLSVTSVTSETVQTSAIPRIKDIKIIGNQRIERDTITSYVPLKEGDAFDSTQMDEALKTLFETGYFVDVQVWKEGHTLTIRVEENPVINRVAFEGNDKLKDDAILKEIHIRPREVLVKTKIQEAQQRILEICRRMGRYSAKVEPKIIKLPENRVDLIFEIHEGPVTHIQNIHFVGNTHFSSKTLRECLLSKIARWYRFFAVDDVFDPDRFAGDQQNLTQFYQDRGYPDFRVVSAVAELSLDQKDFYLTFTLDEGHLYTFQGVEFDCKLAKVDPELLHKKVTFKEGETFSRKEIDKTIEAITEALGNLGYAFVSIEPQIIKDETARTAKIRFEIKQGHRVYIDRLNIVGNDRTHDEVILREISLHVGDPYNATKVKDAEHNLKNLDYFKTVRVETTAGDEPDRAQITATLEEQSTGEIAVAGGYSSVDGPLGNIRVVERNFRGKGQVVHADLTVAKKRQEFSTGIVEPYFLDRRLTGSSDLFHTRSHRFSSYHHIMTGTNLGLGYKLSSFWGQGWHYVIKKENVTGLATMVSPYIAQQAGSYYTSAVTHSIAYDRRDNRVRPTSGYIVSLGTTYAGLGGTVHYLKNDLGANLYHSIIEDVILSLRGNVGRMETIGGKTIRIVDSYMLGADSLRGFEYGGLGPRDLRTRDSLGGTRFWTSTAEIIFPLGLPSEFGIRGAVFTDMGSVWKSGVQGRGLIDENVRRSAVGLGVLWDSPFGPLRIDYAIATEKQFYDETQHIQFGFTTRF